MMADPDLVVRQLEELKALGVLLAMDDFGTGYSSSDLSRFAVDMIKMDRSFLASGQPASGLAAAIIALGASLGLEVIAEGIELAGADRVTPQARLRSGTRDSCSPSR